MARIYNLCREIKKSNFRVILVREKNQDRYAARIKTNLDKPENPGGLKCLVDKGRN